jgi:macrolide transport system ATP-binding/permease protein
MAKDRLTPGEREQDIDREIRAHLELEAEERQDAGMSAEDARYAARRAFGNQTLVREEVRSIWGRPFIDVLLQDVRYAVRMIRRAPGFAAIAVGSSALGIGACSVIFAIVNFAVLTPLPVDDPSRLLSVSEIMRRTGVVSDAFSYPDYIDLRDARSFEGVAAARTLVAASIGSEGDPQRKWGALVTANYFALVKPAFAVGRGFETARDDTPGAPPVIVLSHDLWRQRFGGDAAILGRSISINSRPVTVVGVTAAGFRGTELGVPAEFWIPFSMIDEVEARTGPMLENRRRYWLNLVARLRPGVDVRAARAELDVIARHLNSTYGRDDDRTFGVERAGRIQPELRRTAFTLFTVALGVTALVLLTACANVANLLLGRASARRREIAARMTLGASRGRLLRQFLTESLVLALLGGAGGWMIAAYVSSLSSSVRIPLGWPLDLSMSLDHRVLLFCAGLSIVTAVAFGLVPALRATRANLVADLKVDARSSSGREGSALRNSLVVAQIAICMVLLVCMGLFLRSLHVTRGMDLGFGNRNLLLLAFDPSLDHRSDERSRRLLREILDNVRGVSGVETASLTTAVPLTFLVSNSNFVPEERAKDPKAQRVRTDIYFVGPGFFATMGIPFLAGEDFALDRATSGRVAIVNDAFVRAAFPNHSPVGRRVLGDGKKLEIAGVVATAKSRTIGEAPRPTIYLAILSDYAAAESRRGVTLIVSIRGSGAAYAGPLREAIRSIDPSLAVYDVRTMAHHLDDAMIVPRLSWALSAAAGSVGLVIATIGVYGVINFAVVRRRRELGIRLAIGARPRQILLMILRQGATLAIVGSALGLLAALGVTRFTASLLYEVSPADPLTFIVVPSFLMAVALLACLLPARAAARVDPLDVLRSE